MRRIWRPSGIASSPDYSLLLNAVAVTGDRGVRNVRSINILSNSLTRGHLLNQGKVIYTYPAISGINNIGMVRLRHLAIVQLSGNVSMGIGRCTNRY